MMIKLIMHQYLLLSSMLFCSVTTFSQNQFSFQSTGEQKLLINPALSASNQGLHVQSAFSSGRISQLYTGVSYAQKDWSMGISHWVAGYYPYFSGTKTDFNLAYKFTKKKQVLFRHFRLLTLPQETMPRLGIELQTSTIRHLA